MPKMTQTLSPDTVALRVSTRHGRNFRRFGREFTPDPQDVPLRELWDEAAEDPRWKIREMLGDHLKEILTVVPLTDDGAMASDDPREQADYLRAELGKAKGQIAKLEKDLDSEKAARQKAVAKLDAANATVDELKEALANERKASVAAARGSEKSASGGKSGGRSKG